MAPMVETDTMFMTAQIVNMDQTVTYLFDRCCQVAIQIMFDLFKVMSMSVVGGYFLCAKKTFVAFVVVQLPHTLAAFPRLTG